MEAQKAKRKGKILIAEDGETLRTVLAKYLAREGFEPLEAADGEKAIELYRTLRPEIVISDIMMPRMDGLSLLKEIHRINPAASVILMTGYGNEDILLKALQGGAVNFFKKPFNMKELVLEIEKIAQYKEAGEQPALFCPDLVEETKVFRLVTTDAAYMPVINQIALQLPLLVNETEILNIKIGIEEMITNAIEHGNLGISFQEKSSAIADGRFGELVAQRMKDDKKGHRLVTVTSRLSRELFQVTIRDEGNGFDWQALPDLSAGNLLSFSGRGVFLTKIYFDAVTYNAKGNEVTLLKRRTRES